MKVDLVRLLDWQCRKSKGLAVRLSRHCGHPKHHLTDRWHRWYLKHLTPDDHVFDYGAGSGAHARAIAPYVATVDGWEPAWGIPEPIVRPQTYTAILLLDVLQLVEEPQLLLRRLHRWLTPDGHLFISLPSRLSRWRYRLREAGLNGNYEAGARRCYGLQEMHEELARAGFEPIHLEPTTFDTPWAGLIDLIGCVSFRAYHWLMQRRRHAVEHAWQQSTGFRFVCKKVVPR